MELLFRYIISIIDKFKCACVVNAYERGVILRFGKFHREIGPGFHFHFPLGIETPLTHEVVLTTRDTGEQSLVTADGINIVINTVVAYRLTDIRKILLEVEQAETVLTNFAYGIVTDIVINNDFAYIHSSEFLAEYSVRISECAVSLGMTVSNVAVINFAAIDTVRLLMPD